MNKHVRMLCVVCMSAPMFDPDGAAVTVLLTRNIVHFDARRDNASLSDVARRRAVAAAAVSAALAGEHGAGGRLRTACDAAVLHCGK